MTERDLCPDALIPPNLSRRGHARSSASDNERVPGNVWHQNPPASGHTYDWWIHV